MQFLMLHVDKLIGKDIPLLIIIELISTNLAYMVVLAAPMAVLVATLMAFGRFSELNELTALRASGVNTISIIKPILIASLGLFMFLTWFSNDVLPEANNKARSLFIDIRLKKPGFELQPNIFYDGIEGYTFLVKHIDSETDSLYDITLFQEPGNKRNRAFTRAESGFLKSEGQQGLTLILNNGETLRYTDRSRGTGSQNIEKTAFSRYKMTFDLSNLEFNRSDPNGRSRSDRTMSTQAMGVVVDTLRAEIIDYYSTASESNSLKNLNPKITNTDGNQRPRSIFVSSAKDSNSEVEKAFNSKYFLLNQVAERDRQKRLINVSRDRIENHRSSFETATSNVIWRTKRANRFLVEIHKKFSIPFACVVFVLLGAPLGIMTKRGNLGHAAIISTVILTIYWISIIQGEKLADRLFISPFVGMWSFNIVFSIVGTMMIVYLSTDLSFKKLVGKSD